MSSFRVEHNWNPPKQIIWYYAIFNLFVHILMASFEDLGDISACGILSIVILLGLMSSYDSWQPGRLKSY